MTEEEKIRLEFQNKIMEIAFEERENMWRKVRRYELTETVLAIISVIGVVMTAIAFCLYLFVPE